MNKLIIIVGIVAAVIHVNAHPKPPTAEEAKQELLNAGVSNDAADKIVEIAEKYKSQFETGKSDREAGKEAFESFHNEVNSFIKTQPQADQDAYNALIEKKKEQYGKHRKSKN